MSLFLIPTVLPNAPTRAVAGMPGLEMVVVCVGAPPGAQFKDPWILCAYLDWLWCWLVYGCRWN